MDTFPKRLDNNGVTVVVFYTRFTIQTIGSLLNPCLVACFCSSIHNNNFNRFERPKKTKQNNSRISQIVAIAIGEIIMIITIAFFGLESLVNDLAMTHDIKTQAR